MLPARRPRLLAERYDAEARAVQAADEQRARALAAKKAAQAAERARVRKRRANSPFARTVETARGWIVSVLGALVVSLALTWLVRHPQVLDSLARAARSLLHLK